MFDPALLPSSLTRRSFLAITGTGRGNGGRLSHPHGLALSNVEGFTPRKELSEQIVNGPPHTNAAWGIANSKTRLLENLLMPFPGITTRAPDESSVAMGKTMAARGVGASEERLHRTGPHIQ